MNAAAVAVPYESQTDAPTIRDCGAACLSMVYRSLGRDIAREEIWPAIAKPNHLGSVSSTTHLMAQHALRMGMAAVAIQARHPLQALRICRDAGIRAILNHRLKHDAPAGHYTVLLDIDDRSVLLHDPFYGPSRCLSHAELLELWQPLFAGSEIVGNMLIGIAPEPRPPAACAFCHTALPASIECPKCKRLVGLQPDALLGCVTSACIARMWNYLCCPSCDCTWTFSMAEAPASVASAHDRGGAGACKASTPGAPPAPDSAKDPWNLDRLFGELDKFASHIHSLPAAAAHPEIQQHLAFMAASKEKLKLAQAEELAHRKATAEQISKLRATAQQAAEAHSKAMEDLNRPSPPLDAHALGRALLRNLGYSD